MSGTRTIRVDLWSDVQCIWCYISSARLDTALARHHGTVHVVHHSFHLTPDAPVDIDRDARMRSHMIDPERMRQIMAHLRQLAALEGLAYEPDLTQPTNSSRALQLLHHAGTLGGRSALTKRLFEAYFAEGRHVGHIEELLSLAEDVGLDRKAAAAVLSEDRYAGAVEDDMQHALLLGARGAPFFVIDGTYRLSGAQSVEQLLGALDQARRK